MSAVESNRLSFSFSGERLTALRALHEDSCNVLFLSNEALSTVTYLSRVLLWATRWHGGKRGEDLPEIAREIYEEINMNTCTVAALGVAIGEALSMTINVNNQQIASGCCDLPSGTVLPDGTIVQPPITVPPDEWGEEFPYIEPVDACRLAYACWEYGGVILDMLEQLRTVIIVLALVAAVVAVFVPPAWAVLLGGTAVAGLTAVFAQLTAESKIITEAVSAGQNWETGKDAIICNFVASLGGGAVDVENQFISAMIAVYGGLLDENGLADIVEVIGASSIGDWLQDNIFDGGDFAPLNMPEDYVCCPLSADVWEWEGLGTECAEAVTVVNSAGQFSYDGEVSKLGATGSYYLKVFMVDALTLMSNKVLSFTSFEQDNGWDMTLYYGIDFGQGVQNNTLNVSPQETVVVDGTVGVVSYVYMRMYCGNYSKTCPVVTGGVVQWSLA